MAVVRVEVFQYSSDFAFHPVRDDLFFIRGDGGTNFVPCEIQIRTLPARHGFTMTVKITPDGGSGATPITGDTEFESTDSKTPLMARTM